MSKLNRNKLQKLILQEFKMMGMAPMTSAGLQPMGLSQKPSGCDSCGSSPCGCDEYDDMGEDTLMPMHNAATSTMPGMGMKGSVSREDCCAAVMCLVECCSCPVTKQALMECCEDIMSGDYDH